MKDGMGGRTVPGRGTNRPERTHDEHWVNIERECSLAPGRKKPKRRPPRNGRRPRLALLPPLAAGMERGRILKNFFDRAEMFCNCIIHMLILDWRELVLKYISSLNGEMARAYIMKRGE
jgi:hypothetical protein